jgi:hypothetical protein
MTPEQPPVLSPDAKRDVELAACLLFTAEPSDRALTGWSAAGWMDEELRALGFLPRLGIPQRGGDR